MGGVALFYKKNEFILVTDGLERGKGKTGMDSLTTRKDWHGLYGKTKEVKKGATKKRGRTRSCGVSPQGVNSRRAHKVDVLHLEGGEEKPEVITDAGKKKKEEMSKHGNKEIATRGRKKRLEEGRETERLKIHSGRRGEGGEVKIRKREGAGRWQGYEKEN